MNVMILLGSVVLSLVLAIVVPAQAGPLIQVDEFGNGRGTIGPGFLSTDPGPNGRAGALTYSLPFAGVQGDVGIGSPSDESTIRFNSDIVRFNGDGTLIIYSDPFGGLDAPADISTGLTALYTNLVALTEVGTEGSDGVIYTPVAGQPGFDPSGPTYVIVSDGRIPEPSTLFLLMSGLTGLVLMLRTHRITRGSSTT